MNQGWSKSTKILVGVCVGIFFMCMGSCAVLKHLFAPSKDALTRVTSPDGKHDVVLVEVNGGATTDYVYWICVVPTDSTNFKNAFFVADGVSEKGDFGLVWEGEKLVAWVPKDCREFKRLPRANLGWWRSVEVEYR